MTQQIKLKYYNSTLKIGFNTWKEIYDCNAESWLPAKEHKGRVVYGNNRLTYAKIKSGIDKRNFVVQEYMPF